MLVGWGGGGVQRVLQEARRQVVLFEVSGPYLHTAVHSKRDFS